MTPQAQRIAIAQAHGWRLEKTEDFHGYRIITPAGTCAVQREGEPVWLTYWLPDYLSELNAMHEAEKVLTDEQFERYRMSLWFVSGQNHRYFVSSKADQRAEAFLRTLNLWDDAK